MTSLMDVGEAHNIHPADKEAAGKRLAYLALAKTYNQKGFEYSGPILKEMIVEGSVVKLTLDHAKYGLTTFGKELTNFKVAGENTFLSGKSIYYTARNYTVFSIG